MLEGPDHTFTLQNAAILRWSVDEICWASRFASHCRNSPATVLGLLDRAYRTGVSYHGHEVTARLLQLNGELATVIFNLVWEPWRERL